MKAGEAWNTDGEAGGSKQPHSTTATLGSSIATGPNRHAPDRNERIGTDAAHPVKHIHKKNERSASTACEATTKPEEMTLIELSCQKSEAMEISTRQGVATSRLQHARLDPLNHKTHDCRRNAQRDRDNTPTYSRLHGVSD